MHSRIFSIWSCLLLMLASPLCAHSDTIIELKNGRLVGLPARFQPAALDLGKGLLTISGKKIEFSDYLKSRFAELKQYDLEIVSSWYHEPKILPPYISLRIAPKGRDYAYKILVDMEKLVVREAQLEVKLDESSWRFIPIDPALWKD